jgi:3-oxoacyl-(acyl-carrier-protein) synthase
MTLSNATEDAILRLVLHGTAWTGIAQNHSSPLATLWFALYIADPGEAGTATTSETAYTGYARRPFDRDTDGFTIPGGAGATLTSNVDFAECTASPGAAITHAAIVDSASGAGNIIASGALSSSITMAVGTAPRLKATTTTFTLD